MQKKAVFLLLLFYLATAAVIAGCTADHQSGQQKVQRREELVVAVGVEKEPSYDPVKGWGQQGGVTLFQSKLLDLNSKSEFVNDLATSYQVSKDGLTWTFTVRNDAFFHDGIRVTAKDVAFTFNLTKAAGLSTVDLTRLDRAEAKDDKTVLFHLNTPMATFLYQAATLGIVPAHAYSEQYGQHPIGSGPYKFVRWDKGQQLIVERNEHYYGGMPPFKRLVLLFLSDDAAVYAALQSAKVDVAKVSEQLATQRMSGYHLVDCRTVDFRALALPVQPPGGESIAGLPAGNLVTSNLAIRKALATGLNRRKIISDALHGFGEPAFSMAENMPWDNEDIVLTDGNVEGAKKILTEAGWLDRDGDGIREKNGVKAEFTLMYSAGEYNRQAIGRVIKEQAKALGIHIRTEELKLADMNRRKHQDVYLLGGGSYSPDPLYRVLYGPYATRGGWYNIVGYRNETVDSYLEAAITATTEQESNDYWKKAQWDGKTGGSILGDAPYVYIANISHLYFVRDELSIGTQKLHTHDHGFALLGNIMDWSVR